MPTIRYSYTGLAPVETTLAAGATAAEQTAAIQQALDAVAGHAGALVTLSAGTFTVVGTGLAADGILRVHDATTFEGAGIGQTVIKLADGASGVTGIVRTASGAIRPDGGVVTTADALFRNFTIDGNAAHTKGNTDGFYCGPQPGTAAHDTNITVDSVEIMNVSRYGFDPHEQTVGLTIANSIAHDNGVDGIVVDFCSDVQLINDQSYANGRHGVNIVTSSSRVTITNADVHGNGGSGIVVQTGDNEIRAFTSHIAITGGSATANGASGIEVHQADDIAIDHFTFSGNTLTALRLSGVNHATLAANTMIGATATNSGLKVLGYIQDFADADPGNDRYIASHDVTVDGVAVADPVAPAGAVPWNYSVTTGDDTIIIDPASTSAAGLDAIAAGSGNDTVSGGPGADILTGEDGDDVLDGNDGNDILAGGAGNDVLHGGNGDDRLDYSGGLDVLDGGAGIDTADFSRAGSGIYVNLGLLQGYRAWTSGTWNTTAANATTPIADLIGIEAVRGSGHSDTIVGDSGANRLDGDAGGDVLYGGAGNDEVYGGDGNDTLVGNADIFAHEADLLSGGKGNDVLYGEVSDTIDGGSGYDVLYAVNAYDWSIDLGATSIELFIADFGNDTIDASTQSVGVEVVASGGNDTVTGSAFSDRLWGGTGNDVLAGGEGDDMLFGDVGADTLSGGGGNDVIYADATDIIDGGAGYDVVYITAGSGMSIDMAAQGIEFVIDLAGGSNTIDAAGMTVGASVYTGSGADTITGSGHDDVLWGMAGNDAIAGGAGNDVLVGGAGADVLTPGSGADRIYMSSGSGGDGSADRLVLTPGWGSDIVFDFEHGIDRIDMTKLGTSFAALTISSTPDGAALVTLGGNHLQIEGLAGQLTASDFQF